MKTDKPTTESWTVLTTVNVLKLIYLIHLLLRANSADEEPFRSLSTRRLSFSACGG
jgi:hypothetical protein